MVLLLLGAIVNVAVAWSCVLLVDRSVKDGPSASTDVALEYDADGYVTSSWQLQVHHMGTCTIVQGIRYNSFPSGRQTLPGYYGHQPAPTTIVPGWAMSIADPAHVFQFIPKQPDDLSAVHCTVIGSGWPMRTCACTVYVDYSKWGFNRAAVLITKGGFQVKGSSSNTMDVLPYRPIWSGFAINSIFCALLLALLWCTPIMFRRWHRVRKGRCPKCAYDLQHESHTGCPECGWHR
jgi:hypothetical protein